MSRVWTLASGESGGHLTLADMHLRTVPDCLLHPPLSTQITDLNIFHNNITRLPPEFGLLTNLRALRADESALVFPSQHAVGQMEHMRDPDTRLILNAATAPFMALLSRIADCARNRCIVLPGGAWSWRSCNLDCQLTIIPPEVLRFTQCKLLDLRQNEIKDVPAGIAGLSSLTALHLDWNNLRVIDEAFSSLHRLKAFTAAHNELFEMPDIFDTLTSLEALELRDNRISSLPDSLARCASLTQLSVSKNKIAVFPDGMAALTALRYLHLGQNPISRLPAALGASPFLVEATVDRCPNLAQSSPADVLAAGVPPRCPLNDHDRGPTFMLSPAHRLVARLASPSVRTAIHLVRIHTLRSFRKNEDVQAETARIMREWANGVSRQASLESLAAPSEMSLQGLQEASCDSLRQNSLESMDSSHTDITGEKIAPESAHRASAPEVSETSFSSLAATPSLRTAITTQTGSVQLPVEEELLQLLQYAALAHSGRLGSPSVVEAKAAEKRCCIEYQPADTIYSRNWRVSNEGVVKGHESIGLGRLLAAGMPQFSPSPATVRYLWGLWGAEQLGVVEMGGIGMSSIKADLLDISWITKLFLSHNRIVQLPDTLTRLTQLVTLDVSHNMISRLPASIGASTTLEELILAYNMLDALPKEIALLPLWKYPRNPAAMHLYDVSWAEGNPLSFPHPQILQLGPNHVRAFLRQIILAVKTGKLDMEGRELPLFPDQLTDFSFLVDINLAYNKIDRIPPSLTKMTQLRVCMLAGNSIDRIPARLSSLTSLQLLDVRDNQLQSIPVSIGALAAQLRTLMLGRNRLTALPPELGLLSNLERLHVNCNLLSLLPEEIGQCTALVDLQLSYNKLRQIPDTLSNLTCLTSCALQNNLLELLPTCLGNMPRLRKLAYANNLWQMPQQEVLAWSKRYQQDESLKLSMGMKVLPFHEAEFSILVVIGSYCPAV